MKPLTTHQFNLPFKELSVKINLVEGKHENLLANANVSFKFETGEYFTITGFGVWKSKFGGLNVTMPRKAGFTFCLFEKSLWSKIKNYILDAYEYESVPLIKES